MQESALGPALPEDSRIMKSLFPLPVCLFLTLVATVENESRSQSRGNISNHILMVCNLVPFLAQSAFSAPLPPPHLPPPLFSFPFSVLWLMNWTTLWLLKQTSGCTVQTAFAPFLRITRLMVLLSYLKMIALVYTKESNQRPGGIPGPLPCNVHKVVAPHGHQQSLSTSEQACRSFPASRARRPAALGLSKHQEEGESQQLGKERACWLPP